MFPGIDRLAQAVAQVVKPAPFDPDQPEHYWLLLLAFPVCHSEGDTDAGGFVEIDVEQVIAVRGPVCYYCGLPRRDAPPICIGVGGDVRGPNGASL
jgi:hypothetical protein